MQKKADQLSLLKENINALKESLKWLNRSYEICKAYKKLYDLPEEGMDAFESFTSRFARTTDLLFNKVFRGIAYLEEGEQMTWLDTILFMEKTGIIDSSEEARLIKELRNDIVHEYVLKDIIPLFDEVTKKTPVLLRYSGNAIEYEKKLEQKIGGK